MKGKFILSCVFSKWNVNNLKKKTNTHKKIRLTENKQNLKRSLWCLSRGVAHMRMVSFLSVNQALSMQSDMWQAWYITVRHCLIQNAQRSIVQLHSPHFVMPWSISQLKYTTISSYNFPAQSSLLTKSKTWVGKSQPPEQMPLLELYKDMAGWGWCHWRQIHTWDECGSLCPLTNFQPLCLKQRSEMFTHTRFYQRVSNNHLRNLHELPSKMHFSSEKKVTT